MTDHLLARVIAALHQHVRPSGVIRFKGVSSSNTTTRSTASSAASTSARARSSWTGRSVPFSRRHRGVAVEPDDQPVAGGARLRQHPDMAGMEKIEAAIGEADAQALPAPFGDPRVEIAARRRRSFLPLPATPAAISCAAVRPVKPSPCPGLPTATAAAAVAHAARLPSRRWPQAQPPATASTVSPAPETVAHLDRMRRHVDQARRRGASVMPCSLRVTSTASLSASAWPHGGVGDVSSSASDAARVASANSLRFGVSSVAPR